MTWPGTGSGQLSLDAHPKWASKHKSCEHPMRLARLTLRRYKGIVFVLPTLIFFLFFYYYPLIDSLVISLEQGGVHYREVVSDGYFWQAMRNTVYFSFGSTAILVLLSTFLAFFLDEMIHKKWERVFSTILLLPLITSFVAAGLVWEWIFNPTYGSLNLLIGIVGIPPQAWLKSETQVIPSLIIIQTWLRLGFGTLIILSGLKNIPAELYQAAEIDGSRFWQRFFYITLPLVTPQILIVSIIEMISNFKVFDQIYVSSQGGPNNASRSLIMYLYDTAFSFGKFGKAGSIAVLIFLMLLLLSILQYVFARRQGLNG